MSDPLDNLAKLFGVVILGSVAVMAVGLACRALINLFP